MSAVRGIGFDLDHTLAIDNRLERVALLRLLGVMLEEGGRTIGTLADEIESIDDLLSRQRRGDFTIDDAVRTFATQHSVEPADRYVETFRRWTVEMVGEFVIPLPGVKTTLDALAERGIAIAILSNGWNPLQARKAEQAGFRGPILVSGEIGEQKPAAHAFERLLQALGTDPEESWYVGDDPHCDVAGAQSAGMQSVWINWEAKQYPSQLRPPEHTISEFAQLLDLLPAAVRTR
ncbi:MAG TPA: HAD family hydrolase [Candidatus Cybelea sp.]|jgi:putative hydrolase of the HAD superfamily|nr:HAD family hydrolase [Candidatus Cybelea sp.]